ncbi:MAG TPA: hypothetical protein VK203_06200 [Nostocaceae cyanobacterium]|nr:hypothetical protein [Nostocaceae cyanobacterium]
MFNTTGIQLGLFDNAKHPIQILREQPEPDPRSPIVVSCGGGRNSTYLLIRLWQQGIKPDLILFADTGNEKRATYEYIEMFSGWLVERGMPPIITVRRKPTKVSSDRKGLIRVNQAMAAWRNLFSKTPISQWLDGYSWLAWWKSKEGAVWTTLAEECIITGTLPSKAYGRSNCSQIWKIEPQELYVRDYMLERGLWYRKGRSIIADVKVRKFIGFHCEEVSRLISKQTGQMRELEDKFYRYEYPLMVDMINNLDCQVGILAAGLPIPPKSSCVFCPRSRKEEIDNLSPEDLELALFIEWNAMNSPNWRGEGSSIKGLGQRLNWTDYVAGKVSETELAAIAHRQAQMSCNCIDD